MTRKLFSGEFGITTFILNTIYFWLVAFFFVEMSLESRITSFVLMPIFLVYIFTGLFQIALLVVNIMSFAKKQRSVVEIIGYIAFIIAFIMPFIFLIVTRGYYQ